ncbi:MAG TPA: YbjN domain-containing protein [Microlunatus sp.]
MTSTGLGDGPERAATAVREALAELDLDWSEREPGLFSVTLPGTRKLTTECALQIGRHGLSVRAFVARNPEADHERVYRWLLQKNLTLYGVAFGVDALGDVYLSGRVSLAAVTPEEVDRLLGAVAGTSDDSFNTIVELGFADSIRREWAWRRSRGESTANLAAFTHLDPGPSAGADPDPSPRAGPGPQAGAPG